MDITVHLQRGDDARLETARLELDQSTLLIERHVVHLSPTDVYQLLVGDDVRTSCGTVALMIA